MTERLRENVLEGMAGILALPLALQAIFVHLTGVFGLITTGSLVGVAFLFLLEATLLGGIIYKFSHGKIGLPELLGAISVPMLLSIPIPMLEMVLLIFEMGLFFISVILLLQAFDFVPVEEKAEIEL